jgi:Major Facilitator Superfamily
MRGPPATSPTAPKLVSLHDRRWTPYALLLSSLVLVGGALGDRYGRSRIFTAGVAVFALASAACGLAPDARFLIAARALQGAGAALLVPGRARLAAFLMAGALSLVGFLVVEARARSPMVNVSRFVPANVFDRKSDRGCGLLIDRSGARRGAPPRVGRSLHRGFQNTDARERDDGRGERARRCRTRRSQVDALTSNR